MKSIYFYIKDGEPSRTTHRFTLTKQFSANADNMSHLIFKIHNAHKLFGDFEEVEKMLESMEHADGLAVAA